jgi:NADH dehydrogenase FAD-containing subunit
MKLKVAVLGAGFGGLELSTLLSERSAIVSILH